jgi:hypothetical protein
MVVCGPAPESSRAAKRLRLGRIVGPVPEELRRIFARTHQKRRFWLDQIKILVGGGSSSHRPDPASKRWQMSSRDQPPELARDGHKLFKHEELTKANHGQAILKSNPWFDGICERFKRLSQRFNRFRIP